MEVQVLCQYCLQKPGVEETFPFSPEGAVFKVMGKMFAILFVQPAEGENTRITLKCDPTQAQLLRQTYPAVQTGYHMNKRHWNTITCDGTIPEDELYEMIDNSYDLVVAKLTRKDREWLERES
jgi:predicted DNA-binding protein (MmcQ/YjbR family)